MQYTIFLVILDEKNVNVMRVKNAYLLKAKQRSLFETAASKNSLILSGKF